jgi:flagellar biogenesis protein FliO
MISYVLIALAAGLGLGWIWLRFSPKTRGGSLKSAQLRVLSETKISRIATLSLIQVQKHSFVIGAHPHGLQLLAQVQVNPVEEDPATDSFSSFGRKFGAEIQRKDSPLERMFSRSKKRAFTLQGRGEHTTTQSVDPLIALAESTPAVLTSRNKV